MKIFVYGMLIDKASLDRCAGKPVITQPEYAMLRGFTRVYIYLRGARVFTRPRWPRLPMRRS
ncbi:hypothetical protein [Acidocella aromatica]|uniref:Gamma-glutamylcyclotransferase AIG2-like domain-containing protein n=1 Tax=Acidocella aromatica TaxID=1303579 RepID=A0A840VCD8_9PROT|nr:hypothetical protein [Acidocella aromatica]MBB5372517.1 hypothetical protein [Acidocella aromatica]